MISLICFWLLHLMEQIWTISSWQHIFIRRVDETVNKRAPKILEFWRHANLKAIDLTARSCVQSTSVLAAEKVVFGPYMWSCRFCFLLPSVQENFFSTDSLTTGCRDPWKLAKKPTVAAVESKAQMAIAKCLPGTPGYWIKRWMCRCLDFSKNNNLEDKSQQQSFC